MRAAVTASAVSLIARRTRFLEPELLGLPGLVRPGSVCVDVGAAAGLYTVALSRLAGPSGQVHSVEPLSIAHPVWARVLGARGAPNVHHHPVALGVEPGTGVMSVPVRRFGAVTGRSFLAWKSSGLGSNAEFPRHLAVQVEVTTLDDLCASAGLTRLDFIKVDVEGGELHVLEGGQHTIDAFRPAMLIEIEGRHVARYEYSPDDIVDWLAARGYTMHTWQDGWRETGGVSEQTRNYLFRPASGTGPQDSG
jgi:FkbM family methyltransferase